MFHPPGQSTLRVALIRPATLMRCARRFIAFALVASFITTGYLMRVQAELAATAGNLDPTFSGDGKVTTDFHYNNYVNAIAIQPDGKIVAVGVTDDPVPNGPIRYRDLAVARYNKNGQLDQSFGTGGRATISLDDETGANDVIIQPDKKILIGGYAHMEGGANYFALVRYDTNGQLDPSFGTNGKVVIGDGDKPYGSGVNGIALQPDGKIVAVGGGVYSFNFALARFNSDGSLDDGTADDLTPTDSFGIGGRVDTDLQGFGSAHDVALQPDGKIVVVGDSPDFAVARYNRDGSLDQSFDGDGEIYTDVSGGDDLASSVALQPNGKIVVAGVSNLSSNANANFALARYNTDGSPDQSFGLDGHVITDFSGTFDRANAVVIQIDGKIIAAGSAQAGNNDSSFALARYLSNGNLDPSFGQGGRITMHFFGYYESASSLALQSDGRIVVAGRAVSDINPSTIDFALARYTNDARSIIPILNSLTLSSSIVSQCGTITGTVALNTPAPAGGSLVSLSTTNEAASVPATIRVPAGKTTQSFTINITQGTTTGAGNVIAQLGPIKKVAQLVVRPVGISSVTLSPNPVTGPGQVTGVLQLSCQAPAGGITVTLSSRNPSVAAPTQSSVFVPAGSDHANFELRTADVSSPRSVVITATGNGFSKSAVLTVQ